MWAVLRTEWRSPARRCMPPRPAAQLAETAAEPRGVDGAGGAAAASGGGGEGALGGGGRAMLRAVTLGVRVRSLAGARPPALKASEATAALARRTRTRTRTCTRTHPHPHRGCSVPPRATRMCRAAAAAAAGRRRPPSPQPAQRQRGRAAGARIPRRARRSGTRAAPHSNGCRRALEGGGALRAATRRSWRRRSWQRRSWWRGGDGASRERSDSPMAAWAARRRRGCQRWYATSRRGTRRPAATATSSSPAPPASIHRGEGLASHPRERASPHHRRHRRNHGSREAPSHSPARHTSPAHHAAPHGAVHAAAAAWTTAEFVGVACAAEGVLRHGGGREGRA